MFNVLDKVGIHFYKLEVAVGNISSPPGDTLAQRDYRYGEQNQGQTCHNNPRARISPALIGV